MIILLKLIELVLRKCLLQLHALNLVLVSYFHFLMYCIFILVYLLT